MISACLVIHNDEKTIKKCLDSIKKIADEIIVVHDGPCSDDSLKIVSKYTGKVFVGDHIGEAEPHRNFTFRQAKGEWLLQIDADEYLVPEMQKTLKKYLKETKHSSVGALWAPYKLSRKKGFFSRAGKSFIWKRKKMNYFSGVPHAIPQMNGSEGVMELRLGHSAGVRKFSDKIYPWTTIQAAYLRAFGDSSAGLLGLKFLPLVIGVSFQYLRKGVLDEGIVGLRYLIYQMFYHFQIFLYLFFDSFGLRSRKYGDKKRQLLRFKEKTLYSQVGGKTVVFSPGDERDY
jgi:glycosyltransferase involved in cell wall biosynthesis